MSSLTILQYVKFVNNNISRNLIIALSKYVKFLVFYILYENITSSLLYIENYSKFSINSI